MPANLVPDGFARVGKHRVSDGRDHNRMDLVRLGSAFRLVRVRRGWRQTDVAARAGRSRSTVARVEQGGASAITLGSLAAVAEALGIQLTLLPRWRGSDLDRLLDAGHAAMHDYMARRFGRLDGWTAVPEASFSIYGERGVIDILAFHAPTGSLLVVELKTLVVDVSDLIGTMDRRRRLATRVAAARGWQAVTVSAWVIVADTMTNRRRVEAYRNVLRSAFPAGAVAMRGWLRAPAGSIAGLSFLSYDRQGDRIGGRTRVRPRTRLDRRPGGRMRQAAGGP